MYKKVVHFLALSVFAVSVSVSLTACSTGANKVSLEQGMKAPSTSFTMLDGSYVVVDDMKGKTLVVMFWGTWCSKSKQDITKLDEIAARFKGRNDVVFVAASLDKLDDLPLLRSRIQDQQLSHVQHAFSGNESYDQAYQTFGGDTLPHFFVIGPDGLIRASGHSASVVEGALEGHAG